MMNKHTIHLYTAICILFVALRLESYFTKKPTIASIKKSWQHVLLLQRTRKKLSKEKLEKKTIFTQQKVKGYQTSLISFEYERKMAYIIYYYVKKTLEARICMLYCQPNNRKSGFASYLMLKCIEHLKKKKIKTISLYACPFENILDIHAQKQLVSFYQKFGFEVTDRKFAGVVMQLDLQKK